MACRYLVILFSVACNMKSQELAWPLTVLTLAPYDTRWVVNTSIVFSYQRILAMPTPFRTNISPSNFQKFPLCVNGTSLTWTEKWLSLFDFYYKLDPPLLWDVWTAQLGLNIQMVKWSWSIQSWYSRTVWKMALHWKWLHSLLYTKAPGNQFHIIRMNIT